jgi:hypothetical protein
MASTTTPLIGLFKATPGTNEPFRTADINDNWDILDTFIVGYQDQFDELVSDTTAATTAAIDAANDAADATTAALDQFETDSAAAIATLDTEAIIEAVASEALNIDGGTA